MKNKTIGFVRGTATTLPSEPDKSGKLIEVKLNFAFSIEIPFLRKK